MDVPPEFFLESVQNMLLKLAHDDYEGRRE